MLRFFIVVLVVLAASHSSAQDEKGQAGPAPSVKWVKSHSLIMRSNSLIPIRGHEAIVIGGMDQVAAQNADAWKRSEIPGILEIWNAKTMERELTFNGDFGAIFNVAVCENAETIVTRSMQLKRKKGRAYEIRTWNSKSGESQVILEKISDPASLAINSEGSQIAVGRDNGDVWIWDIEQTKKVSELKSAGKNMIAGLTYSPNGKWLATSPWVEGPFRVYDTKTWKMVAELKKRGGPSAIEFSPDSQSLAISSEIDPSGEEEPQDTLDVYNTANWELKKSLKIGGFISQIAFNKTGTLMASTGSDEYNRFWNADSLELISVAKRVGGRSSADSIALVGGSDPVILSTDRAEMDANQFQLPLQNGERKVVAAIESVGGRAWFGVVDNEVRVIRVDLKDTTAGDRLCSKLRLLRCLQDLDLGNTSVGDVAIQQLTDSMPKLKIVR